MRYRKLSANGDYTFAQGPANFYINVPQAVAQAVVTRLLLLQGEWFLDLQDGTPWNTEILGKNISLTYDPVIQERILDTPGVTGIASYSSNLDSSTRRLAVSAEILTLYGTATVQQVLATP